MTRRPDSCPDCGASCSSHTGSYCEACGTTLVAEPLRVQTKTVSLREQERREASDLAETAMYFARENDGESGLVCGDCGTVWNRLGGLRRLADLDCVACPAIYSSVAHNEEGE